ncbi:transcriptional regulator, PadR-like family [Paenibacillus curdlanolyticus YK9]|uniref:Transcriptional regulator, PadR-like family n=1 Tax=Paenibacillus curdlanolyticus YK9 TaxID=717606 RepID=E0IBL8_9BACL|nr:helix-turn-helix transcriptional regulator [Paenibacillus curdlanolyticus]EFM10098.1 transcriptional regulator, PadR-like family [Paenibacillus curdlanolyticus YK9]
MSMKLLVLGLLMEGDKHPYEIRQTIKQRNWDESFKLRDGSLYYAVDQLRADQLIEAAEIVPTASENRPDKTIFRITDAGKTEFLRLLYVQFGQSSYPQQPIFLGLPFVRHADPDKIIQSIEQQIANGVARLERLQHVLAIKGEFLPKGSSMMIKGFIRFGETERLWLEELLELARSGELFEGSKWTPEQLREYQKLMMEIQKRS